MSPTLVRKAIKEHYPVVLPLGVIEYHAEHLPLGVDTFCCIDAIRRVEKRHADEMVVLPPFHYGAASFAVASPENNGTVSVDAAKIIPVAEEIFSGLLTVGFRNIHAFIAHQTEEFAQGMPTDLAFKFAGRHVIFNWLDKASGQGWWGTEQFSSYYSGDNNPFAWIQIHPIMTTEIADKYVRDHAGKGETSSMLNINPNLVDMSKIDDSLWYARPAVEGSAEFGDERQNACADNIEAILFPKGRR